MCGILGAYLESPTEEQITTIKQLFVESQIRGRHASGYTVLRGSQLFTQKAPLPAETFVQSHFAEIQSGDYTLQLIGHCRYSTSDLRFNQPLTSEKISIVHNGVVTQDPPETWGRYGYTLETQNDSELLLRALEQGKEPFLQFSDASIAMLELRSDGKMRWGRNGKRPLYQVKVKNGYFLCSTADIARRAGLNGAVRCKPGVIYTPTQHAKIASLTELCP